MAESTVNLDDAMSDRDRNIRDQAARAYDQLTQAQARDLFIRQHVAMHNIHMAISYYQEGESAFKDVNEVLASINQLCWSVAK